MRSSRQLYDDALLTDVDGIDCRFSVSGGELVAIEDDDGETASSVAWIQTR